MHGDAARMAHHFIITINKRRPKVDENVNDEHDVHDVIHDNQNEVGAHMPVVQTARFWIRVQLIALFVLREHERSHVGRHDCRVDDKE